MRLDVVSSNTLLNTVSSVLANVVRVRKHVEDVLLLIRLALVEPEEDTTDECQDGNSRVVPNQQWVFG